MANVYVVYDDGSPSYNPYIKSYDSDGNYLDSWAIEATENVGNALAVDISNNVYTITSDQHSIKKRNSSGTLLLTKTETNFIYNIAVDSGGYIYTQEYDGSWNAKIVKRNAVDLTTADTLELGNTDTYYGMTIDSSDNFFLINGSTHYYEKWTWVGGKITSYATTHYNLSSLGVATSALANIHWLNHGIYLPKTLDPAETDVELEDMASPGAVGSVYGEYFLFSGYNAANDVVIGKYDTTLTKVWVVVVASSANYGSVGSYPFAIPVTVTTLAPILIEDGIANLRLELEDKGGLSVNPVGWYCDENAAPSTEYIERGWRAGIGEIDISLGVYSKYVKTLPTGQTTLYVQAWADDSDDNRYTGSILSFDIPTEAEYLMLPDLVFPEFPEIILPELPEIIIELPAINFDISLDLYLDRTYTRKDMEELRQKCINFEKNYTDFCLVLNHNTLLVKNFLQSVYNNGVLGGESEMFAKVYPSQQLKILYLEPLEPIDFKGIINRFINNNTSNSMGLNHNFDLFTEWLNDYNYTSDGYKASYIMPKEEIITNNEPTVKYMKRKIDKLQKEVSVSSREIMHNFNLMKEIIQ